jgi:hypothetical protein
MHLLTLEEAPLHVHEGRLGRGWGSHEQAGAGGRPACAHAAAAVPAAAGLNSISG